MFGRSGLWRSLNLALAFDFGRELAFLFLLELGRRKADIAKFTTTLGYQFQVFVLAWGELRCIVVFVTRSVSNI